MTVQPAHGLTQDEVEQLVLESVEHAHADFTARRLIELRNKADADLRHTEKGLAAAGDAARPPSSGSGSTPRSRRSATAMAGDDPDRLQRALDRLGRGDAAAGRAADERRRRRRRSRARRPDEVTTGPDREAERGDAMPLTWHDSREIGELLFEKFGDARPADGAVHRHAQGGPRPAGLRGRAEEVEREASWRRSRWRGTRSGRTSTASSHTLMPANARHSRR